MRLAHDLARGQTTTWTNLVNTAASMAEIEEQNPGWPHSGHTTAFNPTPSLQNAVAATPISAPIVKASIPQPGEVALLLPRVIDIRVWVASKPPVPLRVILVIRIALLIASTLR